MEPRGIANLAEGVVPMSTIAGRVGLLKLGAALAHRTPTGHGCAVGGRRLHEGAPSLRARLRHLLGVLQMTIVPLVALSALACEAADSAAPGLSEEMGSLRN